MFLPQPSPATLLILGIIVHQRNRCVAQVRFMPQSRLQGKLWNEKNRKHSKKSLHGNGYLFKKIFPTRFPQPAFRPQPIR